MATVRNFELMQYLQYLDLDNMKKVLDETSCIMKYAWIIHDKDVKEDGTLKDPHVHCYVKLESPREFNQVAKWFDVEPQYINKLKSKFKNCLQYLTHANDKTKYQYSEDDVQSNYDWKAEVVALDTNERKEEILRMIDTGVITRGNYFEYMDIVECAKYQKDMNVAFKYVDDRLRKEVDIDMECMYIQGASSSGKTTYAKKFAKSKGYSMFVSGTGADFMDGYSGEQCIILDDIRPSTMSLSDLLKMLDNHTNTTAKSRYYNKVMTNCKLIIITTVLDMDTFFRQVFNNENEPIVQLKRRCKTFLSMDRETMKCYMYDEVKRDYNYLSTVANPVKDIIKSAVLTEKEQVAFMSDFLGIDLRSLDIGDNVESGFVDVDYRQTELPFDEE